MKSPTDKPVDHDRAAGLKAEARTTGEAIWRGLVGLASPELIEILDRLERKTIEAERHHAAVLRLEGDRADASAEFVETARRCEQLRQDRDNSYAVRELERGRARAALARVAKAIEAFEAGSGSRDIVVVELGAAVRELEAAVAS